MLTNRLCMRCAHSRVQWFTTIWCIWKIRPQSFCFSVENWWKQICVYTAHMAFVSPGSHTHTLLFGPFGSKYHFFSYIIIRIHLAQQDIQKATNSLQKKNVQRSIAEPKVRRDLLIIHFQTPINMLWLPQPLDSQ